MALPPPAMAVTLDAASPSYTTPDAAADAVSKAFPQQKANEQAAVIIQRPDGSYGYSTVAPQTDHDNFALRALLAKGHKLAGIVHSHPGDDANGQVFSPKDLDVSDTLKVPSFIRFNSDSSIRKYVPGTTKTTPFSASSADRFGTRMKTTAGDPIAQAPAPDASIAGVIQRDNDAAQL